MNIGLQIVGRNISVKAPDILEDRITCQDARGSLRKQFEKTVFAGRQPDHAARSTHFTSCRVHDEVANSMRTGSAIGPRRDTARTRARNTSNEKGFVR